jgi:hypothetical protein
MKRTIAGLAVIGLAFAVAGTSQAQASCHGNVDQPPIVSAGYQPYIQVGVTSYRGMTCARAVRIGYAAYALPGLHAIYGPQFGAGGFGGPFHVGHLACWLYARLSDTRIAKCWSSHEYVKFWDHRDFRETAVISASTYCGSRFVPNTDYGVVDVRATFVACPMLLTSPSASTPCLTQACTGSGATPRRTPLPRACGARS